MWVVHRNALLYYSPQISLLQLKFLLVFGCAGWEVGWAALAEVLLAPREQAWGAAHQLRFLERVLADVEGAGMGKRQNCHGVWTVWGCSSGVVGDCFISGIPALWRKGADVLHGVGWWTLCLNQDVFAELRAEGILTACYLKSPT